MVVDVESLEPSCAVGGMWETVWQFLRKELNTVLPSDREIPLLELQPQEAKAGTRAGA